MSVAFFDLDGTLSGGPTTEKLLVARLLRNRLLGPRQLAEAALYQLRWSRRFAPHTLKRNKGYLAGLVVETVAAEGRALAGWLADGRLRRPVAALLAGHIAAGDRVVLLTGAPTLVARPLAELLGFHDCIATDCAVHDGCFTRAPPPVHPFGADKLRLAGDFCQRTGTTLAGATAYADSIHDLPLLEAVGRPVAVCPDAALARLARRRGWPVVADETRRKKGPDEPALELRCQMERRGK